MPELTLATLQNRVQSMIGLKATGNELTLLTGYLNEGYEDVLVRTRCRVDCGDLETTAGAWKYRMPSGSLAVLEFWAEGDDGTVQQFERSTSRQILDYRQGLSGLDDGVRYYAVEGHDLLLVWPTPTTVESLSFLYVPRPTAMVDSSDTPELVPPQWQRAIEFYACWRMGDYDDDGSSQVGQLYRVMYEGQDGRGGILRQITQDKRWQGGRRLAPARAGRRPQWRPSSRAFDA